MYWLSVHAPYACRHRGGCCSSGWDIPIEKERAPAISQAVEDGRIGAPATWFRHVDGAPDDIAGVLAVAQNGRCVFHGSGCAVHSVLGHSALPAACQHFPRVALIDARGVFVTLSHYCPTAACWMAYQGNGLVSIATYLRLALAVLRTEVARRQSLIDGIRHADLLLRHLIDRDILAARLEIHD